MSFRRYVKDKLIYIISFVFVSIFVSTLLSVMGIDFGIRFGFYKSVTENLEGLDCKYLLSEVLESPSFYEGQLFYECLKESNKAMNDEINKYAMASKEYREYIELWIHEVKTPVASTKLIIENHPSEITESIGEEIDIINNYLVQALFYSRSNTLEQDYIIKSVSLKNMVFSVMRKNSKGFIYMG